MINKYERKTTLTTIKKAIKRKEYELMQAYDIKEATEIRIEIANLNKTYDIIRIIEIEYDF